MSNRTITNGESSSIAIAKGIGGKI